MWQKLERSELDVVPTRPMTLRFNHWTSGSWSDVGTPPEEGELTCRVDAVFAEGL
jgi:hypothetical protein